jgi:hypothetical protein
MELPQYFLADLPEPAAVTPAVVTEACLALKSNRRQFLRERNTESMVAAIAAVAEDWLDPDNPFRRRALAEGPGALGFSRETLAAGLDAFFRTLTAESLRALLTQDLGHDQRLEKLSQAEGESFPRQLAFVQGPPLLVHVTAGRLPNPALTSMVHGLLLRSAQFVKCATGTALLPRLFAHSLREVEAKVGACLEIAEWPGARQDLTGALFAQADCVTAMGGDDTIAAIRQQVPWNTRLVGYSHRVSIGYVAAEALSAFALPRLVAACARDVIAWDQLGCLSPHAIYVETGHRHSPHHFAELLAAELDRLEAVCPRGRLSLDEAAGIAARRGFYEIRAAHSRDTALWRSTGSTAWTVVYENDPRFHPSCLNRFIFVKGVANVDRALEGLDCLRGQVSTVGLGASGLKEQQLAQRFAAWGVTRVCPLGRMQEPPLTWRHDGRPSLADLVTWTDWEPAGRG